ncbi:MAG: YihY/virulence factor BrkB family protein [Tissierellia bacterium]|nr:YihY/virulence factor BrkB family protein [Tissierellia bacterium]
MKLFLRRVQHTTFQWKIVRVIDELLARFSHHKISAVAAQMTYFFILSCFPFLITLLNTVNFINEEYVHRVIHTIESLPPEIANILLPFAKEVSTTSSGGLFSLALIGGLWAASNGLKPAITAINFSIHEGKNSRSILEKRILGFVFTILLVVLFLVTMLFMVFGGKIDGILRSYIDMPPLLEQILSLRTWIGMLVIFFVLYMLFYVSPKDKKTAGFHWYTALPGSFFVCGGIFLFSKLFHVYVKNFGKYSMTYGSLGGIIVFLVWLYLVSTIVLAGAELNATLWHLKKHRWDLYSSKTLLFSSLAKKDHR